MTVSRVINGESNVRDTTRELVMEAVRALNYRPNPAARVLAGARDTRIALIYSNPSASYLSEMLVGALDGSHRTATQLVLDRWDNLKPAAGKGRRAAPFRGHRRRDPAAAAVRIESHRRGVRRRRCAGGGARNRPRARGRFLRAHRRFPRGARDDRAPHRAWATPASPSSRASRRRRRARSAWPDSRRRWKKPNSKSTRRS